TGKPIQGFNARSMERMINYAWPGNVRELQNIVERSAILAKGSILELEGTVLEVPTPGPSGSERSVVESHDAPRSRAGRLQDVERLHILDVLKNTGGVVEGEKGAARILGMHPNTLRSRMKKLGISSP